MPTGYTAGIIDGSTKTFKDFAKKCMRAFGAAMHMRDEAMDTPYKPDEPSDYHLKEIQRINKTLSITHNISDKDLLKKEMSRLKKEEENCVLEINKIRATADKLTLFLDEAKKYSPPTGDHEGIKKFMIEQLESAVDHDGSPRYYIERLGSIKVDQANINAADLRQSAIYDLNEDLKYHTEEYSKEVARVNERNEWAKKFLNSVS